MKALSVLLLCYILSVVRAQNDKCDLSQKKDDKDFPDLKKKSDFSYELSVILTLSSDSTKELSFHTEYYDFQNVIGRVDTLMKTKTISFYYYNDTNESFEVNGETCETNTFQQYTPKYMNEVPTDWSYKDLIRGPSAMFANALDTWKAKTGNMAYMGVLDDLVNGLKAQYWRHCRDEQTIDYFFTVDEHDDAFGFDKLKVVPLKVVFGKSKTENEFFPQTYDIVSFQPFISDDDLLLVPGGIGCQRRTAKDIPDLPDFSDKSIFTFAGASYVNTDEKNTIWNYVNNFAFALDTQIDHMAYFYTPFGPVEDKEQMPNGYVHSIYDMKYKYLYQINLATDECTISRPSSFLPKYYLPEDRGYLDLTDPLVFMPNNEFKYVTEEIDRGYKVHTFERITKDYNLGNRTIPKLLSIHKYAIENVVLDSAQYVKNTSTSYQFKLYSDVTKPATEIITMNLYGFSTTVPNRQYIFNVERCFRNNDDYLYVTFGFPLDPAVMSKIQTESTGIEESILDAIMLNSELHPLRIPHIFVDFTDALFVTVMIMDRPPVMLDYLDMENGNTITGGDEVEGIMTFDGCAKSCLESEVQCWGFAFCGSTCYYGTGEKAKVENKEGCLLYRRYKNETTVPTKEAAATGLRYVVEKEGFKIAVPIVGDSSAEPIFLKANYYEITSPGEQEGVFSLMKKQTDPRLQVIKAGAKLDKLGENVRNFGKLRYEECQKLCLDYKRCETVSYCVKDSQCILSSTYGSEIPKANIKDDNYCNLLSRKYSDHFDRSAGNVLAGKSDKVLKISSIEDCSRACLQEKDFDCMSFNFCPNNPDACLLRKDHRLTIENPTTAVVKDINCGHYSKKFSYTFKKEDKKRSVGVGFVASTNASLEECAKMCVEYGGGYCYGFDYCEDATLTSSSCILLNDNPGKFSIASSPICTHFTQPSLAASGMIPKGKAAWVGIVCFIVAAVFGVALTFGIAYFRANRQTS